MYYTAWYKENLRSNSSFFTDSYGIFRFFTTHQNLEMSLSEKGQFYPFLSRYKTETSKFQIEVFCLIRKNLDLSFPFFSYCF